MVRIQNVWEAPYKHGRRRARHRCRACWKVLSAGEDAVWLRKGKGTWVLHAGCADTPHSPEMSWRQAFEAWGRPAG